MTTALSASHNEAAFYRNRKAMLVYPAIILPFVIALYALGGGGKGKRLFAQEAAGNQSKQVGFNASMPTAKGGNINGRTVENPAYGKAAAGQLLSTFTHTSKDTTNAGLKALPISNQATTAGTGHASSLAATAVAVPITRNVHRSANQPNAAALAATARPVRTRTAKGYTYQAPGSRPYYTASASDQQLDQQLRAYETARQTPPAPVRTNALTSEPIAPTPESGLEAQPASVRLSDNLTASRLSEPVNAESAFNTAPTEGSRRNPERALLSGSNSYGAKKTVAWLIPVVIHDDQTVKPGNSVKLRLLKEVSADGITIPANTILYAVCQLDNERLRMTVRNVQLGSQLIPLDLEVYDLDGSPGVNMPGISSQAGGQLRSSAIQGVQLPGVGGLVNSVANTARMNASQASRQTTMRLRSGYNLYLKAQ